MNTEPIHQEQDTEAFGPVPHLAHLAPDEALHQAKTELAEAQHEFDEALLASQALKARRENEIYDSALDKAHQHHSSVFSQEATNSTAAWNMAHVAAEKAVAEDRATIETLIGGPGTDLVHVPSDPVTALPHIEDDGTIHEGEIVEQTTDPVNNDMPENFEQPSNLKNLSEEDAMLLLKNMANVDPRYVLSVGILQREFASIGPVLAKILPGILKKSQPYDEGFSNLSINWQDGPNNYALIVDYIGDDRSLRPGGEKLARKAMRKAAQPDTIRLKRIHATDSERSTADIVLTFHNPSEPKAGLDKITVSYNSMDPRQEPMRNLNVGPFDQARNPTFRRERATVLEKDLLEKPDSVHPDEIGLVALALRELAEVVATRKQSVS